ncbi:acyl-CoA/acyl-ACP dehydrogenase [Streptomyces roseoverticillatus]|uniref:acyl-CoA dehydrogenase family protein n=1 Tax=Streptomyces roseoverticillatus TaxID=66429 RepID=UPI001F423987|nr:acyl-CoA dehydrogenase family protein [Streptomyces roseoverticillatus]MCF3103094.1 acyl-CoA/acyl-ACP dehydrogenase [Streptomyces roseoverticillatus]
MSAPAHAATQPAGPTAPLTAASLTQRTDQVAAVAAEHLARTDRDASFPVEALAEMRRTGLLGLLVPTAHGGLGGTTEDVVTASIALGRTDMSVAMIFAMHCQQVAALVRYGNQQLRDELLPEIAAGRVYLASVTTEAGKGGHLLSSESALTARDGELLIDRFAPIVTGGEHADGFLVTMQSPPPASPHQVSLVYAHRDQLTIERSGDWQPLGMRASHSVALRLTGTVPAHHVVGEHGDFRTIVTTVFAPMAHLGWSACWLGTAAGALSRVIKLLRGPQSRGRVNLDSELLLTRLSRARQRIETVHALLAHTQQVVATADDLSVPRVQLLLNSLKITAAEECHQAVDGLIDAVGMRHGYLKDSPTRLEHSLRDLRSAALNYSNDRLHLVDGKLALLDAEVRLA